MRKRISDRTTTLEFHNELRSILNYYYFDTNMLSQNTSTVDAMIGANKLKPMVVISLNAGGKTDPYEQRSLELNTRDDKYGEFLETEVIPLVEKKFNLQISKEAKDRAVIGTSSGAANVSSYVECFNQFIIIKLLYIW